ncbi:HPr kinase/phosphorylase [Achromobacter sp. GG226]|uniref:HPr(Ser) kinase/phosphatase n=1 Tax=Verticiella alkaliphila TaxID=2779529 RepID=UPI001C0D687F|nr:HPr(Ser) kinase/phosphatase [Verticiella sp. GG226]MBU4611334.1 HPr kinase/phosphorylase [Verticiella sp. GG226]
MTGLPVLTIRTLADENASKLSLRWLGGEAGDQRTLGNDYLAPSDRVGHLNLIHPSRIQVFGQREMLYFSRFDVNRRQHHLDDLVTGGVPAIVIADALVPPADLIQFCDDHEVPLLSTPVQAAEVIDILRLYVGRALAPTVTMHGVFIDVLGLGVLIAGESGLGKSELALELVSRGHGLVADDAVDFSHVAPGIIDGHCPPLLQNILEVRGLGLLDVRTIFGESSVRRKMRLRLIVQLVRALSEEAQRERLPLQDTTQEVLGLPIRKVVLPVAAGRNLAVLVEAAVRNTILQLRGIDTLADFMERQQQAIQKNAL